MTWEEEESDPSLPLENIVTEFSFEKSLRETNQLLKELNYSMIQLNISIKKLEIKLYG